jgi:hypothetical protein
MLLAGRYLVDSRLFYSVIEVVNGERAQIAKHESLKCRPLRTELLDGEDGDAYRPTRSRTQCKNMHRSSPILGYPLSRNLK